MNEIDLNEVLTVLGDINGDGFNDILLKEQDSEVSRVIRFPLRDVEIGETITNEDLNESSLTIEWPSEPFYSSLSILPAGDINGDGFDEIAVKTNYYSSDFSNDRLYVVFGRSHSESSTVNIDNLSEVDGFLAEEQTAQYNSIDFGGFADIDGDGFDDLLIGRPYTELYYAGSVKILFGDSEGNSFEESVIFNDYYDIEERGTDFYFGEKLSSIGDINQDGLDDFQADDIIFLGNRNRRAFRTSIVGLIDSKLAGFSGADQRDNLIVGSNQAEQHLGFEGNDIIIGLAGDDSLLGNRGNDKLTGNRGSDVLKGQSGNDVLSGGGGNDLLLGGSGRDRLLGGSGADRLMGGSETDSFVFQNSQQSTDQILDFNPEEDLILFKKSGFGLDIAKGGIAHSRFKIGTGATDRSDRIIYNDQTGALLFDPDGSRSKAAVEIASLSQGLVLSTANFKII